MNAQEIINYFTHAHKALWGMDATQDYPYAGASDAPFDGYCPDQIAEVCYAEEVKRIVKDAGKASIEGVETHHLNAPIKVVKGGKDERGVEGVVVKVIPKDVGEGYALKVYDVFNHKGMVVSSKSVKIRPYTAGERDRLTQIITLQNEREAMFTINNADTLVKFKDVPEGAEKSGLDEYSIGKVISMPNKDTTIWSVTVEWSSGLRTAVALSNLILA